MNRGSVIALLLACTCVVSGCAVSGTRDVDYSRQTGSIMAEARSKNISTSPVSGSRLPDMQPTNAITDPLSGDFVSEKFDQSGHTLLTVDAGNDFRPVGQSGIGQAYARGSGSRTIVSTRKASLKPFVGRWILKRPQSRGHEQTPVSSIGMPDRCELILEDASVDYGHRATGSAACPTILFMLDSWIAFDNRLVLRDHMGDEIVKLTSRGGGVWVGVSREGNMIVLNKG